jgi:hypothetical protein
MLGVSWFGWSDARGRTVCLRGKGNYVYVPSREIGCYEIREITKGRISENRAVLRASLTLITDEGEGLFGDEDFISRYELLSPNQSINETLGDLFSMKRFREIQKNVFVGDEYI